MQMIILLIINDNIELKILCKFNFEKYKIFQMIVGESELPLKDFKFTELFWRSFIFINQFSL